MHTSMRPADVLLFQCGYCHTELSVPLVQQGVVGPCPCCAQQIRAPQTMVQPLFLPPLDGAHEAHTLPVPLPAWRDYQPSVPEEPVIDWSPPRPASRGDSNDGLLPRQLTEHESLGFQAKLSIPQPEEPLDDSWRERHMDERRRISSLKKLDRVTHQFLDSRVWRAARMALMVSTGGLCAGLGIYLQDRNWVLDLPWRPGPAETTVEVPALKSPIRSRAMDPADPFLAEDPSDLETVGRSSALLPLPDPVSLPVSAAPIASGKK